MVHVKHMLQLSGLTAPISRCPGRPTTRCHPQYSPQYVGPPRRSVPNNQLERSDPPKHGLAWQSGWLKTGAAVVRPRMRANRLDGPGGFRNRPSCLWGRFGAPGTNSAPRCVVLRALLPRSWSSEGLRRRHTRIQLSVEGQSHATRARRPIYGPPPGARVVVQVAFGFSSMAVIEALHWRPQPLRSY